jgi:hypothetical protein
MDKTEKRRYYQIIISILIKDIHKKGHMLCEITYLFHKGLKILTSDTKFTIIHNIMKCQIQIRKNYKKPPPSSLKNNFIRCDVIH